VLLKSIVGMAHDLGMAVIAEGVADERDALELRQMGCEFAQSYMYGVPLAPDAALRALKGQVPATQA